MKGNELLRYHAFYDLKRISQYNALQRKQIFSDYEHKFTTVII